MADSEDLAALAAGETDLTHRDFRQADLSKKSLSHRDFSSSLLQGAIFNHSDLSNSILFKTSNMGMIAHSAKLSYVDGHSTSWFMADFTDADLRSANFERSHFAQIKFLRTDLREANFKNCVIDESYEFEGVNTDSTTLFDNAIIIRSLAKQKAFRFYKFERGTLVRLPENKSIASDDDGAKAEIIAAANAVERALNAALAIDCSEISTSHMLGHNNPPPDQVLRDEYFKDVFAATHSIKYGMAAENINFEEISRNVAIIQRAAGTIGRWGLDKANLFAEEFAKSLGKEAATVKFWIGLWLIASGEMTKLVTLIMSHFPSI